MIGKILATVLAAILIIISIRAAIRANWSLAIICFLLGIASASAIFAPVVIPVSWIIFVGLTMFTWMLWQEVAMPQFVIFAALDFVALSYAIQKTMEYLQMKPTLFY